MAFAFLQEALQMGVRHRLSDAADLPGKARNRRAVRADDLGEALGAQAERSEQFVEVAEPDRAHDHPAETAVLVKKARLIARLYSPVTRPRMGRPTYTPRSLSRMWNWK